MNQRYRLLSQQEQDEIQAAFLLGQERELFCHELNAARYSRMLETLPAGEWRTRIDALLNETQERIGEVTTIINASAMPSQKRLTAAKARLDNKVSDG